MSKFNKRYAHLGQITYKVIKVLYITSNKILYTCACNRFIITVSAESFILTVTTKIGKLH